MTDMVPINVTLAWDLIETPAGDVVLTLFPCEQPRTVLAAGDGIYVGTTGRPIFLYGSAHLSDVVAHARTVVVAEADEAIRRETLVPVRVDARRFTQEEGDVDARRTDQAA